MLIVRTTVAPPGDADAELVLSFEARQKTRFRTRLADGEEVGVFLERGSGLRDGDLLRADDGRTVRIVAAAEALMEARCGNAATLVRAAYHLGNRHAKVELGPSRLRFAADEVLAAMLRQMGVEVVSLTAAFEPEAGAYGGGHHAHSGDARHGGIIHDFTDRSPVQE